MTTLEDTRQEAERILSVGQQRDLAIRVLGGVAVALHSPSAAREPFQRHYRDIDFVVARRIVPHLTGFFDELGYEPNKRFNSLNGETRLIFLDPARDRTIDVFVDGFEMCHRLPIGQRLEVDAATLPLAELLLTKLQIVEINRKDLLDIYALLLDHPIGEHDDETINGRRIAELCSADWGLYRTVTGNLSRSAEHLSTESLGEPDRVVITGRVSTLRDLVEAAPKTVRWKLRARIGERTRWYELPEDPIRK